MMGVQTPRDEHGAMSEINVTPFVDVMLVLLVIFMVAAPLLEQGVDVALPKVTAKRLQIAQPQLVLYITQDKRVFLEKKELSFKEMRSKLFWIFRKIREKEIFVKADERVPYGFVAKVMAEVKKAGIERIGLVTIPEEVK